jgi:membrane peptidoglycan carboxypeptidase
MARNRSAYRYMAYRRRRRNGHGTPRWVLVLIVMAGLALFSVFGMMAATFAVYQHYADGFVSPEVAIAQQPSGGAKILDRNGKLLYQFLDENSGLQDYVPIGSISPYLVFATVATEDSTFFTNPGVNYNGLIAAGIDNFSPLGHTPGFLQGRGGSSITQQLVKNIYFTPEERSKRSLSRKIKEIVYAREITNRYPGPDGKRQIMEWYLNYISYGDVFVGIQSASQGYFGVNAKDLTIGQAATLAAIPSCPSCYDPLTQPDAALEQRNIVLRRMYQERYIDGGQLFEAVLTPLQLSPHNFGIEAPHFVFNVVKPQLEQIFGKNALKRDGLVVYTTLDLDLQKKAQAILEGWIQNAESSDGHNGAVVAMDPNTAQTLVYIGSRDYFNTAIQGSNDMAQALNSPGSSFKPITYVTAFRDLGWGPGTLIMDQPIPSKYWDGKNPPRNPVSHSGPITARDALGSSLNIPAIKTILSVGVPSVIEQAKKMGITTLDGRDLGPSMTVGGVDVTLNDMVYAYTAFPNLGVERGIASTESRPPGNRTLDPVSILRVQDRDGNVLYPIVNGQPAQEPQPQEVRVAPPEESYEITSILSDPNAFCLTYGCGGLSVPGHTVAFKTGTSEPYEQVGLIGDTWTFGYTPQIVVGSWFGNADNSPMHGILSTTVSYRAVRDVLAEYLKDKPNEAFPQPPGMVKVSVCVPSGLKPTANCPITTPLDWVAHPPTQDDNWWQVRDGRRLLVLPDTLNQFRSEDALLWQSQPGVAPPTPTPGQEQPPAQTGTVQIASPQANNRIEGITPIAGTATSDHFVSYVLQYQSDAKPKNWVLISQGSAPVLNGILGTWDTRGIATGSYTVRLVVNDSAAGLLATTVHVVVVGARGQQQ